MITEIILVLFVLAVAIFVYSGIIAPSLRLHLRYRLFSIRDRIRALMHAGDIEISPEQFELLHGGVNNALNIISSIDFRTLAYMEAELKRDEALRKRIEKRMAVLDACSSVEFRQLRQEAADCVRNAFLVNVGTWFLYLVPIAIAAICINKLRLIVMDLSCIPEREFNRLTPDPIPA
jgi:hypothetical protein